MDSGLLPFLFVILLVSMTCSGLNWIPVSFDGMLNLHSGGLA